MCRHGQGHFDDDGILDGLTGGGGDFRRHLGVPLVGHSHMVDD